MSKYNNVEIVNTQVSFIVRLNQFYRVIATGFCFVLFGLGGLILSFICIPIITFFTKQREQAQYRVQKLIQINFALFCKVMRFTKAIDYKIVGAEKLKQDRNCLILANHPSLIDYVLIASQIGQCDCIVKSALWYNPFIKRVVQGAGYIPNRDPEELFSLAGDKFNQGNVLLVFPEGTRTTPGIKPKLQRGAAQIAARTGVDIRIVHISVQPSFLTKERKWYQVPLDKPFFHLEVKGKIKTQTLIQQANSNSMAARKINDYLQEALFPD